MNTIALTVPLAGGSVTLRAWGANHTDALLLDLITVSATLGELRGGVHTDVDARQIEGEVWRAFFRLLRLSLDGLPLPRTTFAERMTLLEAMWSLNDVEAAEGKLKGSSERAQRAMSRQLQQLARPRPTTLSTSS